MAAKAKQSATVRKLARAAYPTYEPPMSYKVAASLLGIVVATLKYHIRKGRIRRVMIPGSKYSLGVVAADVRAILEAQTWAPAEGK